MFCVLAVWCQVSAVCYDDYYYGNVVHNVVNNFVYDIVCIYFRCFSKNI